MKQRDCDFESMSAAELWDFYKELGSKLATKLQAEATLLQRRLDELHARAGLQPLPGRGKRKFAAMPKFRNPRPPFQTWSGRGPRPRWIKEALEHGGTMDSLLIEAFALPQNGKHIPCNFGC
jgi:DNA-binding protein H-NS